jgi:hypothetical protein
MVYRGLYHFTQAYQRGEADDPVGYLAANAATLGIIKRKRKKRTSPGDLLYLFIHEDPPPAQELVRARMTVGLDKP